MMLQAVPKRIVSAVVGGLMKPVGFDYSSKKGYQLIHGCVECNKMMKNKVALDTEQEDQLIYFMKTVI